jgi:hypothetical protein
MATSTAPAGLRASNGEPSGATRGTHDARLVAGYAVAAVLALVPVVRMVRIVLDGSVLQYADYWLMLDNFTRPDGSLDVGGLFEFQNHPIVVPQLIYWVNLQLFSGSNISLGLFVVAVALAQLGIVALLLRQSALGPFERIALFVLASALLFDLTGTWNFAKAMSGTAWLTANLFALAAVYLRSRDRRALAFALAALAAASYGTGIVAWPAVMATGLTRGRLRGWWREWPYAIGLVATVAWNRLSVSGGDEIRWPSPFEAAAVTARMFGYVLGLEGTLGQAVGYLVLVGVPALAIHLALASRAAGVAGWVGVAMFGWLASLQIGTLRYDWLTIFGDQSRYTSLPALTWLGFVALLCYTAHDAGHRLRARGWTRPAAARTTPAICAVIGVPVLAGALAAGRTVADVIAATRPGQQLAEIALRLEITDQTSYLSGPMGEPTTVTGLMRATGHYPFVESWDLDCGLLGERIDGAEVTDPSGSMGEVVAGEPAMFLRSAVEISGRVAAERSVRCVVITNGQDQVVGAATLAVSHDGAPGTGFRALARRGGGVYRGYVIFEGNPRPYPLVGQLTAQDIKAP